MNHYIISRKIIGPYLGADQTTYLKIDAMSAKMSWVDELENPSHLQYETVLALFNVLSNLVSIHCILDICEVKSFVIEKQSDSSYYSSDSLEDTISWTKQISDAEKFSTAAEVELKIQALNTLFGSNSSSSSSRFKVEKLGSDSNSNQTKMLHNNKIPYLSGQLG